MLDDPNNGWAPGQPPPWLGAYGPDPQQPLGVETTQYPNPTVLNPPTTTPPPEIPTLPPEPANPPATGRTTMGPKGRNSIGPALGGGQQADEIPQAQLPPWIAPADAMPVQGLPGSPAAAPGAAPPIASPDAAAMRQSAQVAGGPQPFVPPWLQQPQVDAVSGAPQRQSAETPDQALGRIATDPNAPITDRQKAWQSLPPEQRTQIVNTGDPKALAAIATAQMTPEELSTLNIRHQQAQLHEQSAQQLELARRRDEEARANYVTYQQAVQQANAQTAQLSADAQRLSQEKIDPNEHGVGHFIASVLTSAIGGAMSQYTGGRNLALEQLNKQTEQRIAAQQTNIQNGFQAIGLKRNLIGEQLQRSGDLYHASEAYSISQLDRATAELQTRMQDYDPQGTTSLRSAGVLQQLQTQRQQQLQAYNQQAFKNKLEALKANNEINQQQETVRHNKATEGLEWAKYGLEQQKAKQLTPEQIKHQEELEGRQIGGVVYGSNDDGTVNRGALTVDGKPTSQPFIAKTEKQAEMLQNMAPHVNEVNRLANQMARDIADLGTLDKSSKLGTAAHQRLISDKEALIFALHGAQGIEGFRPGTAEMLEKLLGGVEPDAWGRDASAGILRARDNINADFTGKLHVAGWQGDKYAPPDTSKPAAAVDTPEQATVRKLSSSDAVRNLDDGTGHQMLTPEAERSILDLASAAASDPDPQKRATAAQTLLEIANRAKTKEARAAAREQLQEIAHEDALGALDTSETGSAPATGTTQVATPGTDY